MNTAQALQQKAPREILYLQTDKPSYIVGDTIWFSAYLLDAHELTPSRLSGIVYIELLSPFGGLMKRYAIHLNYGHGYAQMPISKDLSPGNYHIRAYTRWMENFPDSLFFQKEISIAGGAQNWLMNINSYQAFHKLRQDSVSMKFFLKTQTGETAANKFVMININNDKGKTIIAKKLMTKSDGSLSINFNVDDNKKNKKLSLNILDEAAIGRISYPINLSPQKNKIDVQFLPESGHIIEGVKNKIAFKAIDENGSGIDVQGIIKNNSGDSVTSFSSLYKGMGTFNFMPKEGEKYYAELNNKDTFYLPHVDSLGTIIHTDVLSDKDSIIVFIHETSNRQSDEYFLFAEYKGYKLYGAKLVMKDRVMRIAINKSIFPTGINSVTLIGESGQILNERSFFINHYDNLNVTIQSPKDSILARDSIPVHIKVTDQNNAPVEGIFSLAITDNQQVKKDAVNDENILSYFLLSSDLKGAIETSGYYFSDTTIKKQKALDNLMLTQGFVKYDWDTTKMKTLPEPQFFISGKATSLFGKPLKKANITLLGNGKQVILKDTTTDDKGEFLFKDFPLFDTSGFVVQARNKKINPSA
ncbi:MAG: hypothetical protein PW786_03890 [Arachidicoccus sp.]|nr:hypothetical protein [Arachidicoccus sp.]